MPEYRRNGWRYEYAECLFNLIDILFQLLFFGADLGLSKLGDGWKMAFVARVSWLSFSKFNINYMWINETLSLSFCARTYENTHKPRAWIKFKVRCLPQPSDFVLVPLKLIKDLLGIRMRCIRGQVSHAWHHEWILSRRIAAQYFIVKCFDRTIMTANEYIIFCTPT